MPPFIGSGGSAFTGGAAAIVKSIQSGTIVLANGVASNTSTLPSAVVVANAVVIYGGQTSGVTAQSASAMAKLVLTNTTTVTATRISTTNAMTISFTVIEFEAGVIKSNQNFSVSLTAGNATGTATITATVVAKTWIVFRGCDLDNTTASSFNSGLGYPVQTNTTTITATRDSSVDNQNTHGTALEFN